MHYFKKLIHSQTEDLSHHGKSNLLKKSSTSSTSSPDISETVSFTKTQSVFYRSFGTQTSLTMADMEKMLKKVQLLEKLNNNIQNIENEQVFSSKLQCI